MHRKKILWLCGWYPSKLMPYNGDFIKRHAEAVSIFEDITVIHVVRDTAGQVTKSVCTETRQSNGLTEIIIYYYVNPGGIKFFEKISSYRKFKSVYKAAIRTYIKKEAKPDLVHVHMGMQAATVALWLHRYTGIPLVLTEHWTGFLKEATERFQHLPFYLKRPWKKLLWKAKEISVVSKYLSEDISAGLWLKQFPEVVPNVVNQEIFGYIGEKETASPVFLHVSGLDDFKNPLLILKAFEKFHSDFPEAKLNIIGSTKKEITDKVIEMKLEDAVFIHPEMPQDDLSVYMRNADALILYSKYETFGCVIIEANACGTPVIVSDIPVFHETVTEGVNGVFAGKDNADLLFEKMKWLIANRSQFNSAAISQTALSKYGYNTVGKQFSNWYGKILNQP